MNETDTLIARLRETDDLDKLQAASELEGYRKKAYEAEEALWRMVRWSTTSGVHYSGDHPVALAMKVLRLTK